MAKSSTSGQGRPKGLPNRATRELKDVIRSYCASAVKELARLALQAESEQARVSAIKELLDRGYGKSHQTSEVTHISKTARELTDDELAGIVTGTSSGRDPAQTIN